MLDNWQHIEYYFIGGFMKKSKGENTSITAEKITDLVNEVKTHIEKIIGKKLYSRIYTEDKKKPFWRIAKDEEMSTVLCTIYFDPLKKEIGFWCTHENLTPGSYSEHGEISSKIQELSEKLGLTIKDLNKPKRIR